MTLRSLSVIGAVAAPGIVSTGCSADCSGTLPRCDVAWPGGRLTMIAPLEAALVEATDVDAVEGIWTGRVDALVDHGTDWSADVVGDRIVIGLPDANGVYVVDVAEPGVLGSEPWLGGERRFGEVVRALAREGGDSLFVGAPGADLDRGSLSRFRGFDLDSPAAADLVIVGETPNDRVGAHVTTCGDVDGDGWLDLVVGAPTFQAVDACGMAEEPPPDLAGAVFVLRSGDLAERTGEVSICEAATDILWGAELGEQVGAAVACTPSALYVGAPLHGLHGEDDQNQGVVYRVPWTALPGRGSITRFATSFPGPARESAWGSALAGLSIVGQGAVLVGAPAFAGDGSRRGRVELLVEDGSGGLASRATIDGEVDDEQLGLTVLAGDLDGDGVDDVLIGSPDVMRDRLLDVGRLWLWPSDAVALWSGSIDRATAAQIIEGTHAFSRVGRKLTRTTAQGRSVLLVPTRARPSTR